MLISFIVPVYNADKYIKRCLQSLQGQTNHDFEVVLIDDGSTDGSGTICDTFTVQDNRFRILHQQNKGVAEARQKGLELCTGEYIAWVDADDYVEPDYIDSILPLIRTQQADVINIGSNAIRKNGSTIHYPKKLNINEWRIETLLGRTATVWSYISKRSLWKGVTIPTELKCSGEDGYLTMQIFYRAQKICGVHKILYNHLIDSEGSIRHTYSGKIFQGNCYIWKYRLEKCSEVHSCYTNYCAERAFSGAVKAYSMSLVTNDLSEKDRNKLRNEIRKLKKHNISGRYRDKILAFCIEHNLLFVCKKYAVHKLEKAQRKNRIIQEG